MKSKKSKDITKKQNQPGRSLKKNLAIAAVAASLGVSLGVPVKDVLAVEEQLANQPEYSSAQDKQNISAGQHKENSIQQKLNSKQGKIESKQDKLKSAQGKIESRQDKLKSVQGKIESSQLKEVSDQGKMELSPEKAGTVNK